MQRVNEEAEATRQQMLQQMALRQVPHFMYSIVYACLFGRKLIIKSRAILLRLQNSLGRMALFGLFE